MIKKDRPPPLSEIFPLIRDHLRSGSYILSKHAIERKIERNINLSDVLFVLKNGYHDKQKTKFDENFQTWKYAVRGKTIDLFDIRIIIAFDDQKMLIVTVMHVLSG